MAGLPDTRPKAAEAITEGGFNVTEWCNGARRSVNSSIDQLERQRTEVELKTQFWLGYLAAVKDLETESSNG